MSPWGRPLSSVVLVFVLLGSFSPLTAAQSPIALEKIILAVPSPALSMLPVFFAQDRGHFKKEGVGRLSYR